MHVNRLHQSRAFWLRIASAGFLAALSLCVGIERRALAEENDTPATQPAANSVPSTKPTRMQTAPMPTTRMDTTRVPAAQPPPAESATRFNSSPMRATSLPTTRPIPPKIEPMNTQRMTTTRPTEGSWRD